MKLIIQIPCFNEEQTLPKTIADLPIAIEGIDVIETLVIDDGSTDKTVEVALGSGVTHVVRNKRNQGLARTFRKGLETCVALGADIIVNTDGDNQYAGSDIEKLVKPIIAGAADIVIGDRNTDAIDHFSPFKKQLQRFGTRIVQQLSGTSVSDAVSGFRALSREAAQSLNIVSSFSYTTEMVIQAGRRGMTVQSVPVGTNPQTRPSRLFKSMAGFIGRSATTMVRTYAMYHPMRVFFAIGAALATVGAWPIARFLVFYFVDGGSGHLQSLLIGGTVLLMGFVSFLIGLLADLIAVNRKLLESCLERTARLEDALRGSLRGR